MQIFEFYFNPKASEDRFFDSFIYEPKNTYEKKLGSLYAVGELKNALPQNSKLLEKIANTAKEKYYTISFNAPERAISEGLKKANEFLSEEVKKENVSWLGNLDFTLISLKDFDLTFTKTGDIKVLLIRGGQVIDIGKNLDLQEIDPYPLKIFFNIVSGKLILNDVILIATKDIYGFFLRQNIIKGIAQCEYLDEKKIKEILPPYLFSKKEGAKVSGVCFLAVLNQKTSVGKKPREIFYREKNNFLYPQFLKKYFKSIKKFIGLLGKPAKIIKKTRKRKIKNLPKKTRKNSLFPVLGKITENPQIKKGLFLILFLAFLLFLGFLIF